MKIATFLSLTAIAPAAFAVVYTPLPEQKRGSDVIVSLATELAYDSNTLLSSGTAGNPEFESAVWKLTPGVELNASLTDQTFAILSYTADISIFEDRGTTSTTVAPITTRENETELVNHTLRGLIEHSFNERLTVTLSDTFMSIDEPETSVVGGAFVDSNRSFNMNSFDARADFVITEKHGGAVKYNYKLFAYDAALTATLLDRDSHLFGAEYRYFLSETTTLVGEYRYQDVTYDDTTANFNSNSSSFYLVGADITLNEQLSTRVRLGAEDREYDTANLGDDTSFYGSLVARYNYGEQSYVSGGFTFDTAETTTPGAYIGEETLTVFVNAQQQIAPSWFISGSASIDNAELLADQSLNPAPADITDNRIRLEGVVTWTPTDALAVFGSYAYDTIDSDTVGRERERHRVGVGVRYSFGYNFQR